jgi:outer membrane protein TolC
VKITIARLERMVGFYKAAVDNLQTRLDSRFDTPSSQRKAQQALLRAQESLKSVERSLAELKERP